MSAHFEHYSESLHTVMNDIPEMVFIPDFDTWCTRIDQLQNSVILNRPARLIKRIQQDFSLNEEELIRYFGPFAETVLDK